ncbi:C45 family peptidase [Sinomonas sp. ASV322]|uniref:C45 family peptidase n=1 Tax=Sinomonas sp. ASV322 TaxID=3041920 RepID=UPI0027DE5B90|nr:C45 family peptidase [Sinomonas sp. ASV322]MDQ4501379.1 C45 family peptidase [Sinomonas sp. ASV322]
MPALVVEQEIAGLRWLVLSGERLDVFAALGRAAKENIHAVQEGMPEREGLSRWVSAGTGARNYARVAAATRRYHPTGLAELAALARGAEIDADSLLLANLRGDLGSSDGTGCSDLVWRGRNTVLAHNEDAAPALEGQLMFVTLAIDGEPTVTAQWYPGFLPSNAFTATSNGLVWGINHIQVAHPSPSPGRHFVIRSLQSAPNLTTALEYLEAHPMAGGFAVTIGSSADGRAAQVETAAGLVDIAEISERQPLQWHSNHLRRLPAALDEPVAATPEDPTRQLGGFSESVARGTLLERIGLPDAEPDDSWFLKGLSGPGVFRTAAGSDPLMTLCTTVVNLGEDRITVRGAGGLTSKLPFSDFIHGRLPLHA